MIRPEIGAPVFDTAEVAAGKNRAMERGLEILSKNE
jgi:hypothetical protein